MATRRAAILLAALALMVAADGCGDGHEVGPSRLVQIALTEYRLIPQSIAARRGRLTIYAHNYGRLTHNLVVTRGAQTSGSTAAIPPGGTASVTLYLAPGKYLMLSTILQDRDLGIYGTLVVKR